MSGRPEPRRAARFRVLVAAALGVIGISASSAENAAGSEALPFPDLTWVYERPVVEAGGVSGGLA